MRCTACEVEIADGANVDFLVITCYYPGQEDTHKSPARCWHQKHDNAQWCKVCELLWLTWAGSPPDHSSPHMMLQMWLALQCMLARGLLRLLTWNEQECKHFPWGLIHLP